MEPSGQLAATKTTTPDSTKGAANVPEEQQLDPTQVTGDQVPPTVTGTTTEDPELLPDKVPTPEGEDTEFSQDFTISEEGEGDNISGNKELRDDKDTEDENSSKRVKVPHQTTTTE